MDMNRKNHTGNGLRWMEALAREQIASNNNDTLVNEPKVAGNTPSAHSEDVRIFD